MIAFAAVALAVSAQAAKANWGFADEAEGDGVANLSGYTAYLIAAADWDATDVATSLGKAVSTANYVDDAWSDESEPGYAYYSMALKGQGDIDDSYVGVDSAYIVFANGSDYYAEAVSGKIKADGDNSQGGAFDRSFSLMTSDFTSYASAAPEPTSGLLLLLGVAGLALRRRRA